MADHRPLVIQTEPLSDRAAEWLARRVRLVRCASDSPGFDRLLADAEGLVIRTYTTVDAAMLDRAPKLRVVGRAGVGVDNIDLNACADRGIAVVNTPGANTEAVVQLVFAYMLDALRPREPVRRPMSLGEWNAFRNSNVGQRQLDELTLGVYGLGRIGRRVAAVAGSFGMRVIYHDLLDIPVDERAGAEPVSRDELLRQADVLTIHVDGRPSNRGLLDAGALAHLRSHVLIINTSRGFVIDAATLADFLRQHPKSQAWLDVHDPEPIPPGHPLFGLANVTLTPHIAGRTQAAMERMSDVVYDVARVLGKGVD